MFIKCLSSQFKQRPNQVISPPPPLLLWLEREAGISEGVRYKEHSKRSEAHSGIASFVNLLQGRHQEDHLTLIYFQNEDIALDFTGVQTIKYA